MAQHPTPLLLTIFSYQVRFGDCFLLRFSYDDDSRRHVLIDFGTTSLQGQAATAFLLRIAEDIRDKCTENGQRLDVVVATHRHADHIAGFKPGPGGTGPGDIIAALAPEVVLQPWTEDPKAPQDSLGPAASVGGARVKKHLVALKAMNSLAETVVGLLDDGRLAAVSPKIRERLRFIGEDNISNVDAVKNLMKMGKRRVYAYHGCNAGLSTILPGVETVVLGPPTLRQTDTIRKQRSRDPDQFWLRSLQRLDRADYGIAGGRTGAKSLLFPGAKTRSGRRAMMEHRRLMRGIDDANGEMLLGLVTALDRQMNNTSLILLFKAGKKSLLFPGDAQIENWEYALKSDLAVLLEDVDLYKVGHHGSTNATPKDMWARFGKRGPKSKKGRMTSIMSTEAGKHGSIENASEVPRRPLVKALQSETDYHSTEDLAPDALYGEVIIPLV